MCGVVGMFAPRLTDAHRAAFVALCEQARIRGLHAFGVSACDGESLSTRRWLTWPGRDALAASLAERTIFHARYSTSGDWMNEGNNQPIAVGGEIAVAANCVISMKPRVEYEEEFGVQCATDNDAEVFARRILAGEDAGAFVRRISGSFAGAWLRGGKLWAVRNERRPLWRFQWQGADFVCSTLDIARRALEQAVEPVPVPMGVTVEVGGGSAR